MQNVQRHFLALDYNIYAGFGHCRWNIAIKNIKEVDKQQHSKCIGKNRCCCGFVDALELLLDEAKIMSKVGCYHENIVNLLLSTCKNDK